MVKMDHMLLNKAFVDKELKVTKTNLFEKGYLEGKNDASEDLKGKRVNITELKLTRDVSNSFGLGYEIGYLRQLLWTLTSGKIR